MSSTPVSKARLFAEDFGLHMESVGSQRMYGRILGWLLVCDPPVQSKDLVDALGASKGSISTATRVLVDMGLIERVPMPGKRGLHFRLCDDAWLNSMRARSGYIDLFVELTERGLDLLADGTDSDRVRLQEMHDFYVFMQREIPRMLERYLASKEDR